LKPVPDGAHGKRGSKRGEKVKRLREREHLLVKRERAPAPSKSSVVEVTVREAAGFRDEVVRRGCERRLLRVWYTK